MLSFSKTFFEAASTPLSDIHKVNHVLSQLTEKSRLCFSEVNLRDHTLCHDFISLPMTCLQEKTSNDDESSQQATSQVTPSSNASSNNMPKPGGDFTLYMTERSHRAPKILYIHCGLSGHTVSLCPSIKNTFRTPKIPALS